MFDAVTSARCAGIVFRSGSKVLLLRRSDNDHWNFPGGHSEDDETPEQTARREAREEIGVYPDISLRLFSTTHEAVDYTTFVANVPEPFAPHLNDEHYEFGWFEPDAYPSPLLPPVAATLELLNGHEYDLAKAMAAQIIPSPYRYENVWLFDIRITGSGVAYRGALNEYAMRPPETFLAPEFIERCNGLPVIFEHPVPDAEKGKTNLLDSEEFKERIIGTVILPYRKDDEVWGIAKIYDDDAAVLMQTTHKSTSPGVNFARKASLQTVITESGEKIVVEGDPSMIDHIAVCELGVWDKGGAPSGVNIGDQMMTEEEKKAVDEKAKADAMARADAEPPAWAKSMADSVAALSARVDAMCAKTDSEEEEAKKKAEAEKADKAKADAAKMDDEKMDAMTAYADMQKQIADLKAQLPRDLTDEDRNAIAAAKSRADSVYGALGKNVPHEVLGESPVAYRRRLAAGIQSVSKAWAGVSLKNLPDDAFANVEGQIYADAQAHARAPADIAPYSLREIKTRTEAGHLVTSYAGDPRAWMDQFAPPVRFRASGFFNSNRGNA